MTDSEAIGYLRTLETILLPLKYFTNENAKRYNDFCEKVMPALERQNPSRIIEYGICPMCNYDFGIEDVNYCPNCGQRLNTNY